LLGASGMAYGIGDENKGPQIANVLFSILSPFMCMFFGFYSFEYKVLPKSVRLNLQFQSSYDYALIYMLQFVFYMILVFLIENHRYNLKDRMGSNQNL
jgi:hypothetical protein